ncbi:ABC transporter ATPase [Parapedobacter indicus]|uniref:ABC transporter ATPase n=1 Tax=Parapedobacter indicus TaxID=1477437 RepID=A0A1I3FL08_9SPHI|nr:ABC transporter ATPase [Parapedobacter indicus]PPL03773.1 hypothetical protein CLV26_102381 [Parapedobacter indicus]SFI11856.1 hypothetical protein SAMN05444682_102381 [Parapedobacter indicus]
MERVWIYQAGRSLTDAESRYVLDKLEGFTSAWKAHGKPLAAKAEIRYGRFIIIMVDDGVAPPTGCSIDKSVHLLKEIERELEVTLFDRMQIAYRDNGAIHVVSRAEFEKLLEQGDITHQTVVFNNLVATYPDLETKWEVPMSESWHAQVFR